MSNRVWFGFIIIGVIASSVIIFSYQPAISELQTQVLLDESITMQDQLTTQQKLSVMLSESIVLQDMVSVTGATGSTG